MPRRTGIGCGSGKTGVYVLPKTGTLVTTGDGQMEKERFVSEQSDTPRTEAELQKFEDAYNRADAKGADMSKWEGNLESRLKTFARSLERELSEVTRERRLLQSEHSALILESSRNFNRSVAAERELEELRGKKWTQPEAQRLLDFQDAAAQGDINEAYNAIYWLVAGRAENQFKIWEEVTALATPPEK